MKIWSVLLIPLFTFHVKATVKCEKNIQFTHAGKKITVCKNKDTFFSAGCEKIKNCFIKKDMELRTYPDQSPGFSLCYQLGGSPDFIQLPEKKYKIPFCVKNNKFIDQESLLKEYYAK